MPISSIVTPLKALHFSLEEVLKGRHDADKISKNLFKLHGTIDILNWIKMSLSLHQTTRQAKKLDDLIGHIEWKQPLQIACYTLVIANLVSVVMNQVGFPILIGHVNQIGPLQGKLWSRTHKFMAVIFVLVIALEARSRPWRAAVTLLSCGISYLDLQGKLSPSLSQAWTMTGWFHTVMKFYYGDADERIWLIAERVLESNT